MAKCPKSKDIPSESYPCISRWLTDHGTIEFGYCPHTKTFIRVLDEGGVIWRGRVGHESFDLALAECEAGVLKWLQEELGEEV